MKANLFLLAIICCDCLTHNYIFAQEVNSLQQPFDNCQVEGSITIYDYQKKQWISSDMEDSHHTTLPASTFKILNTLIALETGAVEDENEIIPWIGDEYDTSRYGIRPETFHSMSMKEAFQLSAGWAYVELAKRIGKEKYKKYLTQSNYGNVDLSVPGYDFWNFGDFAISPANQIETLIGVYEETLPFSANSFRILKDIMIVEQRDDYVLRAKTGWTRVEGKNIGWWVGYVEKKDNVYFFATRLINDRSDNNQNFGECRKTITRDILRQLNIVNGR